MPHLAALGSAAPHWSGGRGRLARAGGGRPGRTPGRALCPLAGDARRAGECADDGADAAADGNHAQKKTLIAGERDDAARARWRTELADIDPTHRIFLDEPSTPTTLTPARGRSDRGTRGIGRVPRGRWDAVTVVATLTAIGLGPGLQVPGAVDRMVCDRVVTEMLVPTRHPGDVVVLDNVAVPKRALAQQAVEAVGASLVFLPPYSPDFNPIEQAFAKLKQRLRTVNARTSDTVMTATRELYPEITPSDARGFFAHAGYFF